MATKKYLSLERLAEYDALIKAEIAQGDESAKSYADSAATTVKNDLLNGAGEAYDTLKELGDLINVNTDALQALETVATNKADKSDVTTLQELVGETSVDERIETAFANSGANIITPLVPYDSALSSDGSRMNLKFHLEEMEFGKTYGIQSISNVSNYYIIFTVTCDDGTVKNAYAALGNFAGALFKIAGNASSPDFYYLTAGNTLYSVVIDWSDKSTANNVKITYKPIALTTTNTFEFVPTSNYHPATKKYVDDNFASKADVENIDLSVYETKEDSQTKYDAIVNAKADWNQNDSDAVDYIKNRTHYEDGETVHQLDEKFIPDTIARISDFTAITNEEIDEICGASITPASENEVTF